MKKIDNYIRIRRLINQSIQDFSLDLRGISVLTEAASGAFVVTPLIAALAGAESVIAVTRDSRWGNSSMVKKYTEKWAAECGVSHRIKVTHEEPYLYADSADLVTNLGFVRPINEKFINLLPQNSAISLMWETWEFREGDLDLETCKKRGIPILGTREDHPGLQIFRYIGLVVLKLLFEAEIEVFKANILIIGSTGFGMETRRALTCNGANVLHIEPLKNWNLQNKEIEEFIKKADAIVIVEHNVRFSLIGGEEGIPLAWLKGTGLKIIHICGKIDDDGVRKLKIKKNPAQEVECGYMTTTTDYIGPRPVIELHTAGLRVGETLVRGMRKFGAREKAIAYALKNSPAMDF